METWQDETPSSPRSYEDNVEMHLNTNWVPPRRRSIYFKFDHHSRLPAITNAAAEANTEGRAQSFHFHEIAEYIQMACSDDVEETRVLIAPVPGPATTIENGKGSLLSLRHPKSGNPACYFFINDSLQEFQRFKQSYRSWFLGDSVCEDGSLHIATTVDLVFILLPIFEDARMKKGDDQGKFRPLDDIMFISGYPGYQNLLSIAEDSMKVVCEIKEIGSSKFYRLDDSKVLAWLCHKVHRLKAILPTLDKNYAVQNEQDTLTDAVSLVGEYLKDEPWLKLLCANLRIDIPEATRKVTAHDILPTAAESSPGSSHSLPVKSGSVKKTSSSAKQAKKMKIETDSHNIKDMFRRSSRKRS